MSTSQETNSDKSKLTAFLPKGMMGDSVLSRPPKPKAQTSTQLMQIKVSDDKIKVEELQSERPFKRRDRNAKLERSNNVLPVVELRKFLLSKGGSDWVEEVEKSKRTESTITNQHLINHISKFELPNEVIKENVIYGQHLRSGSVDVLSKKTSDTTNRMGENRRGIRNSSSTSRKARRNSRNKALGFLTNCFC